MIEKTIYADDFLMTGEPAVRVLDVAPGNEIIKTAYALPPETLKFIHHLSPVPGKSFLLINALGASGILYRGGVWGQNRNADYFAEVDLIDMQDEKEAMKNPGESKGVRLKRYKTFENAYFFPNHSNKDPNKAIGKVLFADYDLDMHRVLLVVEFWRAKDRILSGMIDKDIPISTSMGCRVPGDYCTICNNYSRKADRSDACIHVREMKGKILDDGRRVGLINKQPRFFDISHVIVGADATSRVLMKVASSGWESQASHVYLMPKYYSIPKIAAKKEADLKKELPPDEVNGQSLIGLDKLIRLARNSEPRIPNDILDILPVRNIEKVGAMLGVGIIPHQEELEHLGISEDDLQNVEPFFNEKIASILGPYVPYRTIYDPYVSARLIHAAKNADIIKEASFTDSVSYRLRHPSAGVLLVAGALFGKVMQALAKKLPTSFIAKVPLVRSPLAMGALAMLGYGLGKSAFGTAPRPNTQYTGQIYIPPQLMMTKTSAYYASVEKTARYDDVNISNDDIVEAELLLDKGEDNALLYALSMYKNS